MKKVFFIMAFAIFGTFSFANENVPKNEGEMTKSLDEKEEQKCYDLGRATCTVIVTDGRGNYGTATVTVRNFLMSSEKAGTKACDKAREKAWEDFDSQIGT